MPFYILLTGPRPFLLMLIDNCFDTKDKTEDQSMLPETAGDFKMNKCSKTVSNDNAIFLNAFSKQETARYIDAK